MVDTLSRWPTGSLNGVMVLPDQLCVEFHKLNIKVVPEDHVHHLLCALTSEPSLISQIDGNSSQMMNCVLFLKRTMRILLLISLLSLMVLFIFVVFSVFLMMLNSRKRFRVKHITLLIPFILVPISCIKILNCISSGHV